jgi:hypothetical protein
MRKEAFRNRIFFHTDFSRASCGLLPVQRDGDASRLRTGTIKKTARRVSIFTAPTVTVIFTYAALETSPHGYRDKSFPNIRYKPISLPGQRKQNHNFTLLKDCRALRGSLPTTGIRGYLDFLPTP